MVLYTLTLTQSTFSIRTSLRFSQIFRWKRSPGRSRVNENPNDKKGQDSDNSPRSLEKSQTEDNNEGEAASPYLSTYHKRKFTNGQDFSPQSPLLSPYWRSRRMPRSYQPPIAPPPQPQPRRRRQLRRVMSSSAAQAWAASAAPSASAAAAAE